MTFPSDAASWWNNSLKSMIWWQQWYAEYERMTMHAIKLATTIKADHLILGGPMLLIPIREPWKRSAKTSAHQKQVRKFGLTC
jgi:hypothetical protein